jgi:DNA ligase-1
LKDFAELFDSLDSTTKTKEKLEALVSYFTKAKDKDKIHVIALLTGKRPKRTVKVSLLRVWAAEIAEIPDWLFEQSYHVVGDLAETISLLLSNMNPLLVQPKTKSLNEWMQYLRQIAELEEFEKKEAIIKAWLQLNKFELFLFNKLITGGFRVGVSKQSVIKALSMVTGQAESSIAHRLMGQWNPYEISFNELLLSEYSAADKLSKPYPFYLAYPVEDEPEKLGSAQDWQAEFKWDGIRGQLILRDKNLFVWSRGEELVTDKFPEFKSLLNVEFSFVIDGEILVVKDDFPQPFQLLQTRIGRKNIGAKILNDAPVEFWAYDILELNGKDLRGEPLVNRRKILTEVVTKIGSPQIKIPPVFVEPNWDVLLTLRASAREKGAEGLMLKKLDSPYLSGRKVGAWYKWKLNPYTIDAVMIYAMRGHGRRANLYTDYTFALWDNEGNLIPFTKAYSGLTDKELIEVDKFVKKNTIERFGPVRSVKAELVFEIAFEGIAVSTRHKSGVAVRFPRINRWRIDKKIEDANTLEDLKTFLRSC